jgi:hypothetical protein
MPSPSSFPCCAMHKTGDGRHPQQSRTHKAKSPRLLRTEDFLTYRIW